MTMLDRVQRGAWLLDIIRPGWANDIDTDNLAIGCPFRCIVGQTFGKYADALNILFPECADSEELQDKKVEQHGFAPIIGDNPTSLEAIWIEHITFRRTGKTES